MHLPRRYGRLALALVVSAFAAQDLTAQYTPKVVEPTPEVADVVFEGLTKAIDKKELQLSIYTEPTRCRSIVLVPFCKFLPYRGFTERHYLDRQEFKRDVLRIRVFYFREGFRDAQVDTSVVKLDPKKVKIVFRITEGPPTVVTNVNVAFDSTIISAKKVRDLTLVEVGRPYDLFEMDSTRLQFQNELWEQGYADALIDTSSVIDEAAHTARVTIRLVPNRLTTVGNIAVQGTEKVTSRTVLNSLGFREGDLFRRSALLESQRNLYESNLFKLAALEVPQSFDSVKAVNIVVREAPLRESRIGGGFNTVDFLQAEYRFTNYNLFGGGRRFDLSAAAGNLGANALNGKGLFRRVPVDSFTTGNSGDFLQPTWQTSIELKQPAFLQRPRDAVAISAFAQRRAVPSVVIDRGYGGILTYTRTLQFRAPASLSYRFEVTRVEANGPYFCVNFGVCDTTTISTLRGHEKLSPLNLQMQIDRSDQPLNPMRGYIARGELEHASAATLSDYRYNRAYADGALYSRLGPKNGVLATHLRLGFVRALSGGAGTAGVPVLHPRKRFYSGGSQSVRGFGENQLGPRILTVPRDSIASALLGPKGGPCDVTSDAIELCDPNTIIGVDKKPLSNSAFTPRPVGASSLIEGSVEYRFPLSFLENLGGAVFIDGAALGENVLDPLGNVRTLSDLVRGTGAITPGFGVRYYSSVGPIRVDVGFNPSPAQKLPVVTEVLRNGQLEIVPLKIPREVSLSFIERFTIHLSIGQAY